MSNSQQFRIVSREEARKRREEESRGFLMPLAFTGGFAHVHRLTLAAMAQTVGLPVEAQNTVVRVFREYAVENANAPLTWDRFQKNARRNQEMADALCVVGFIKPRLVATEAELDGTDDCWLVTDIHPEERLRYMNMCVGQDAEAAKALVPFPESPVGTAATVPAGETAATAI